MIESDDIKDRKSLEAWLEALPQKTEEDRAERRRIALTIACQAAACGLPTYWRWVRENTSFESSASVALPFLRSIVVATYASSCDKAHFRIARELAVTTAGEAERVAKIITRAESPEIISKAGFAAVYAADAVSMGVNIKAVVAVAKNAGLFGSDFPNQISFHDVLLSSDYKGVVEDWAWIKNDLKNHDGEQALATDWAFWIWWYDGLLNGTAPAPDSQMMQDIALLPDEVWQDVDTANARINEIWSAYSEQKEADASEQIVAEKLVQAALSDFRFDAVSQLIRMKPFSRDVKFLEDPEHLADFLEDAEDLKDDIERFCAGLKREGASMRNSGLLGVELEALLEEFSKAKQLGKLNVGKIVQYGEFVQEATLDPFTREEFGGLAIKRLEQISDRLLELVRSYFSNALMRFAPLRELELEAGTSAWEYLNELRHELRELAEAKVEGIPALARDDFAVLVTLADEVERVMRACDGAAGETRESFSRKVNYHLALLTVSISLYATRGREHSNTLGSRTDDLLKNVKRAKGLWSLWGAVKRLIAD